MRVIHAGHPITHRLVDRLFQRRLAGGHRADLGTHQAHPGHVQGLPLHVDLAHVNDAFHPEARADRGRGHPVLTGTGFRDDPLLTEPLRQQDLAEGVIDLVGTRVQQVLALQVDFRAAQLLGPALGEVERRRAADVVVQQVVEFRLERRILAGGGVGHRQLLQRGHQGLGHEHAAEFAKVTGSVGKRGRRKCHDAGKETQEPGGNRGKNPVPFPLHPTAPDLSETHDREPPRRPGNPRPWSTPSDWSPRAGK